MKNVQGLILLLLGLCLSCKSLISTTYIEPQTSFVLGEGAHGSYTAEVKNVGKSEIEISQRNEDGKATLLGVLKIGDTNEYLVKPNNTIVFKNTGMKKGTINIKAKGDTNLSMRVQ